MVHISHCCFVLGFRNVQDAQVHVSTAGALRTNPGELTSCGMSWMSWCGAWAVLLTVSFR